MTPDADLFNAVATALARSWMPGDYFQLTADVARHYATKAAIARHFRPARILELGTRAGYSLLAMSLACPGARFLCLDGAVDADSAQTIAHARALIATHQLDAEIVIANTRDVRGLPPADFAHVDGDHSETGALHDLELVAHVPAILADDCCSPGVAAAVATFRRTSGHSALHFHDGLRSVAVLEKPAP